jgi:hypothetical protein
MEIISEEIWSRFSEEELWKLATDRSYSKVVRHEAMLRWLFPADYGYLWAEMRTEIARKLTDRSLRDRFRSSAKLTISFGELYESLPLLPIMPENYERNPLTFYQIE